MIHELVGDQKTTHNTQRLAQLELNRLQMSWEADVEDVYPVIVPANFFFMKEFPNPHKRVYITSQADPETIIAALKTTLVESWSIFRSVAVEYDHTIRLLVVLRATERYFDQAISIHPQVENEQALMEISISGNHAASELPRGLMFRVVVAKIESTKTVGVIVLINHAIGDAISNTTWDKDVEALILGNSVVKRIPHKAFAEAYYLHQTSLAAKLATDYHVKRLRGIGSMRYALWPPSQPVPNVPARAMMPNNKGNNEAVEGGGYHNAQIVRDRKYPNLAAIGRKPSTLTIAAIATFSAFVTEGKHAVFAILLGGRQWPFTTNSLARLLPDPMTIAGPTIASTVMIVNIDDAEQISQFLNRLEVEVRLLKRYQHVPWDFYAALGEEDRAMFRDAHRLFLNYLPNGTRPKDSVSGDSSWRLILDRDYKVDQPNDCFTWDCGLKDADTLSIRSLFNPDVFSEKQVERFTDSVFDIVEFLSDVDNWGKEVCELRAILSRESAL